MNRLIFCAILVAACTIVPFTVLAGPYRGDCDAPPAQAGVAGGDEAPGLRHFERLATVLDLSDDQRRRIDALRESERLATEPYRRQLRDSREAIHALTRSEPFDEGAVRRLARSKADAAVELQVAHARTRSQINALLTTEQRTLAERLEMGPGRRGPGRQAFSRNR